MSAVAFMIVLIELPFFFYPHGNNGGNSVQVADNPLLCELTFNQEPS